MMASADCADRLEVCGVTEKLVLIGHGGLLDFTGSVRRPV